MEIQKVADKYSCDSCHYKCSKYSDYVKHNGTRKHKMATMEIMEISQQSTNHT